MSAASDRAFDIDTSVAVHIAFAGKSRWTETLASDLRAMGIAKVKCETIPPCDVRFDLVAEIDRGPCQGKSTATTGTAAGWPNSDHRIAVVLNPNLEEAIQLSTDRENAERQQMLVLPDLAEAPGGHFERVLRPGLAAIWPKITPADLARELLFAAGVAGSPPRSRAGRRIHEIAMRIIDFIVGLAVMTLGLPIMALLALAIRQDSPGPALFSQQRVGRNGQIFTLYKFRTMMVGTRQAGTHELTEASVTRLGAKLRHLKLDELPQAWNLLTGDLTLVGPRPCLSVQRELVEERRRRGVLALKPGLTGLAQISGIDMSEPRHLARVDAIYASLRGIALDLQIIARTFMGAGRGDRTKKNPAP